MGEIAEMMLDGTMDPETGEWNFDGEDGPGWPMTQAEARAFKGTGLPYWKLDPRAKPPGQGLSKNARRRRARKAAKAKATGQ